MSTAESSSSIRKHPRVCGEDAIRHAEDKAREETPPRMRGRLLYNSVEKSMTRNTPAYAGKTLCPVSFRQAAEKHPRVCGEDRPYT